MSLKSCDESDTKMLDWTTLGIEEQHSTEVDAQQEIVGPSEENEDFYYTM